MNYPQRHISMRVPWHDTGWVRVPVDRDHRFRLIVIVGSS